MAQKLTYAGIEQSKIVESIKNLVVFINKIDVAGTEVLKNDADMMLVPDGYVDTIAKASTSAELAKAISRYPAGTDLGYAARAFEHVLQTYAGIKACDTDPLCAEAYTVLRDLRAWGRLPTSGFDVMSSQDHAAQKVFSAKSASIEAANGMFTVLPTHTPQLGWEFYFHPKKDGSREVLAAHITDFLRDLEKRDAPLASEIPYDAHKREGTISRVTASYQVIVALQTALEAKGLLDDRSVEMLRDPVTQPAKAENANFSRSWVSSYSMRR